MSRPARSYEESKARARRTIEARMRDGKPESIALKTMRQHAHNHGIDSYLEPVLSDMQSEGLIQLWIEGKSGVVYFTEKWRNQP